MFGSEGKYLEEIDGAVAEMTCIWFQSLCFLPMISYSAMFLREDDAEGFIPSTGVRILDLVHE